MRTATTRRAQAGWPLPNGFTTQAEHDGQRSLQSKCVWPIEPVQDPSSYGSQARRAFQGEYPKVAWAADRLSTRGGAIQCHLSTESQTQAHTGLLFFRRYESKLLLILAVRDLRGARGVGELTWSPLHFAAFDVLCPIGPQCNLIVGLWGVTLYRKV